MAYAPKPTFSDYSKLIGEVFSGTVIRSVFLVSAAAIVGSLVYDHYSTQNSNEARDSILQAAQELTVKRNAFAGQIIKPDLERCLASSCPQGTILTLADEKSCGLVFIGEVGEKPFIDLPIVPAGSSGRPNPNSSLFSYCLK